MHRLVVVRTTKLDKIMTIREHLENMLVNHGCWPDEAKASINLIEESEASDEMRGRWDEPADGYPDELMAVLWLWAKKKAIELLMATKPNHFAIAILRTA